MLCQAVRLSETTESDLLFQKSVLKMEDGVFHWGQKKNKNSKVQSLL